MFRYHRTFFRHTVLDTLYKIDNAKCSQLLIKFIHREGRLESNVRGIRCVSVCYDAVCCDICHVTYPPNAEGSPQTPLTSPITLPTAITTMPCAHGNHIPPQTHQLDKNHQQTPVHPRCLQKAETSHPQPTPGDVETTFWSIWF